MIQWHGVDVPFSHAGSKGASCWPPNPSEAHLGPGFDWIVCDGCGRQVGPSVPRGGVNLDLEGMANERNRAVEFHLDHCPKLRKLKEAKHGAP